MIKLVVLGLSVFLVIIFNSTAYSAGPAVHIHRLLLPLASSVLTSINPSITPSVNVHVGGNVRGNLTGTMEVAVNPMMGHVTVGPSRELIRAGLGFIVAGTGTINFFKALLLHIEGKTTLRQCGLLTGASAASVVMGCVLTLIN